MISEEFRSQSTVKTYVETMSDLSPAEQDDKLVVLAEFSGFVERTPDQMVEEIYDMVTQKYKKRGFYTERVKEFSGQVEGGWAVQNKRGNVIRSFFIANGRRIPPEQPPWM